MTTGGSARTIDHAVGRKGELTGKDHNARWPSVGGKSTGPHDGGIPAAGCSVWGGMLYGTTTSGERQTASDEQRPAARALVSEALVARLPNVSS